MTVMPNAVFVSVAGYHHHLGFNTWRGVGIPGAPAPGPSPACATGRSSSTAPTELAAARERLGAAGVGVAERDGGMLVHDPAGHPGAARARPR